MDIDNSCNINNLRPIKNIMSTRGSEARNGASRFEPEGCRFEPCPARHSFLMNSSRWVWMKTSLRSLTPVFVCPEGMHLRISDCRSTVIHKYSYGCRAESSSSMENMIGRVQAASRSIYSHRSMNSVTAVQSGLFLSLRPSIAERHTAKLLPPETRLRRDLASIHFTFS
jgi:hypothetical protein